MPLITDAIGRVLGGRYRLVSPLGVGASAQVFLAEDVTLERHVAVKLLQPALAHDQGFLKRFRAEARSAASLNHPHIARVFDWGEDEGGPYLVLEYAGGGSLLDLLERGVRLSVAQATSIASQAARGLAHAHARGIVHRDVKPANLLFDDEGRVLVADFGVARALAEGAWTEPTGVAVGTARYAAPEQAQGLRLDGRADVYALALVTFESLTGYVPFVLDTPMGTLAARVGATLPGHGALGPLQPLLTEAAAPNMAARPDAATFAGRLESLSGNLPRPGPLPLEVSTRPMIGGPPTVVGSSATVPGAATVVDQGATGRVRAGADEVFDAAALEPAVRRRTWRDRARRRLPWIVGTVLLVLALLAAGLVLALRNGVFTPSHPVPSLVGMTVVQAERSLVPDHFTLSAQASTSTTVQKGKIVSQSPASGSSLKQGSAVDAVVSSGLPNEQIPSLLGLGCAGATRLLEVNHLKAQCPALATYSSTVPVGEVVNWSYAGRVDAHHAPYRATVLIAVSKGPQPKIIPNVEGDTVQQAEAALQALGLQVTQSTEPSANIASGMVAGTNPAIGTAVPPGSTVTILVSSGPPTTQVPNLSGDTVAQAQAKLQAAGLVLGSVYGPARGHVVYSVPEVGTTVPDGTAVSIWIA
jgi:eukaryotic-like serine/threonine-protein kinase